MITLSLLLSPPAVNASGFIPNNAKSTPACEASLSTEAPLQTSQAIPQQLTMGLIPYRPEGSLSFPQFAQKISAQVEEAHHNGANFIMLPELLVQDLVDHTRGEDTFGEQVRTLSKHWPEFLQLNQDLAKKLKIILYSGTFTREENGLIHNSGALIFPDGQTFVQDKLFMTPFEKRWEISPGKKLNIVETPWGNWVNLICYDCEIPYLSNEIAKYKPTLILAPSMTEATSGFHRVRWTAQARAIEHKAYVVHVGMVGGPDEWENHGQCAIIAPFDNVLGGVISESELNSNHCHHGILDFSKLKESRASDSVYPGRDQTP